MFRPVNRPDPRLPRRPWAPDGTARRRRPAPFPAALAGLLLAWALPGCAAGPAAPRPQALTPLRAVADSVRETPPLHRSHWGVSIYDRRTGEYLYGSEPQRNFIPASVTKLVVAAVALAELGEAFRYRTELLVVDEDDPAGARVVVAGRGDPSLSRRFHPDDFAALDSLADSLAARGVARVRELVIDAGFFVDASRHGAWETGDLDWYYAAPVSAFAVAEGTFTVVVSPAAEAGFPAGVQVRAPPGAVFVESAFITDTAGAPLRFTVDRQVGSDTVRLSGSIAVDADPDTTRLAVGDPARYAAHALAWRMGRRGVEVGATRVALHGEGAEAEARAAGARVAAAWHSPPLTAIVGALLPHTVNWIAEQLVKTLGAERGGEGSWAAGRSVQRRYLADVVGVDTLAFRLSDGSGLSVQNLLAPFTVVQLLEHAARQPWAPAFQRALAVPGGEGTLSGRLPGLESRVAAKTGTLTNVAALAGYLTTADGAPLIFAIIVNGSALPASPVRRGIDTIVHAAAGEGRRR
jgi:serine-type D-Ala-D-Ala carboxypeptidase/endopeptidase (penicillin-binding protein 4)